jgi:hypothetical protein
MSARDPMPAPRRRADRGSALVLVVILLAVLAAIGAAAVTLSSRDRINAGAKSRRDLMVACASAAQVKVWAELARYGPRWLGSDNLITELTLADGTRLGPLHYDQNSGIAAKDVVVALSAEFGDESVVDLSNRSTSLIGAGKAYRCVARCTVPGGLFAPDRQLEVEFQIRTRM